MSTFDVIGVFKRTILFRKPPFKKSYTAFESMTVHYVTVMFCCCLGYLCECLIAYINFIRYVYCVIYVLVGEQLCLSYTYLI